MPTILALLLLAFAPLQDPAPASAVIAVKGAKCSMCVGTITDALTEVKGVKSAKVDLKKKTATVSYDRSTVSLAELEKAVAAAGYDANATKRDPKAYKELPGCCR